MHINDPIPKVPGIPPQLEKVIEKATDKYQTNRYKSADELIDDLDNIEFITKVMGGTALNTDEEKADDESNQLSAEAKKDLIRNEYHNQKKKTDKTKIFIIVAAVIVVIAAAVGLGFATGLFGGASDEIEVPDFRGKTLEEAQEEAEKLGLVIEEGDEVYSADQEEGLITSQTPSVGAMVGEGQVITVNVSKGKRDGVVPSILGMDYKEAEEYLQSFGFELGIVKTVTSTQPVDTIVSQSVDAGTTADRGTAIDVEVSDGQGKEMGIVPHLLGLDIDDARASIEREGFTVGSITYEESTTYAQNQVMEQQYPQGTELEEGSRIDLVVSKGAPASTEDPDTPQEPDTGDDSGGDATQ